MNELSEGGWTRSRNEEVETWYRSGSNRTSSLSLSLSLVFLPVFLPVFLSNLFSHCSPPQSAWCRRGGLGLKLRPPPAPVLRRRRSGQLGEGQRDGGTAVLQRRGGGRRGRGPGPPGLPLLPSPPSTPGGECLSPAHKTRRGGGQLDRDADLGR